MRDIEVYLAANQSKLFHMSIAASFQFLLEDGDQHYLGRL